MYAKKILVSTALLSLVVSNQAQSHKTQKPNVVLIIADDHRHDWMHHKGKTYMETPNLDRLAQQGWSFPNAFSCAGVCSPARASLLTGKYMHQASAPDIVWQNNSFLYRQQMFPQILHRQGYKTGYIGKFHLGEDEKPKQGFDLWASFPFVGSYFNQPIWINGNPRKNTGFTDDNIVALSDSTIRSWAASGQPFCLIIGLKSPHIPFTYPERMKDKYENIVFDEPETFDLNYAQSKPGLSKNLINARKWPQAIPRYGSFQEWIRSYTRLATTIDESVGRIMEAVEQTGIQDNTIFIYTSDQGYSLGEFNLCEKHYAYEQVMRIPLIVRFPNQKNTSAAPDDMIMGLDIAPTILDYCTGKIPADMEGKSLRILQNRKQNLKKNPFRKEIFFDFWHNEQDILPPMQAVRTADFKLIKYEYLPFEELYDLKNDPHEENNLIHSPAYFAEKNKLEKKLEQWKKRTGWGSRSALNLKTVYVSPLLESDQTNDENYSRPNLTDLCAQNGKWQKIERDTAQFDFQDYLGVPAPGQMFYVAIPLDNKGDFDPFISLRVSRSNTGNNKVPAFSAWFEGREIYRNSEFKKKNGIPFLEQSEESLRKGFDLGYNPPLQVGENIIVLQIHPDDGTMRFDFKVVGALNNIRWL